MQNRPCIEPVCAPTGIRTLVLALKGLRPGPLDDGGLVKRAEFYQTPKIWSRSNLVISV